jgi:hypothetical protein
MIIDLSKLTDGFSSKLRVISFFIATIKIRKLRKELYIYEKKTKECPFLFTDFCKIKNFKTFKLKKKPKNSIKFNSYNLEALKLLKKKYNIGINNSQKFNQIAKLSYKSFIPNYKISKKIIKLKLPKIYISIHIRTTDRTLYINNCLSAIQFPEMIFDFQINNMLNNLSNFIKSKSKIKNLFICSDDKYYKEKFLEKLSKNYNIFSNNTLYKTNKFRQTSGLDFLTELFCLSKSQIILSTVGGAVPSSAYLMSKKNIKIYKWINNLNFYTIFNISVLLIFYIKRFKYLLLNLISFKKINRYFKKSNYITYCS